MITSYVGSKSDVYYCQDSKSIYIGAVGSDLDAGSARYTCPVSDKLTLSGKVP